MNPKFWIITLGLIICSPSFAQETATYVSSEQSYREALDLFDKEKFASAQKLFERFIELEDNEWSERSINAEYYAGICAMFLFHKDAEYRLEKFVNDHPDSPWVNKVYYELASYNYKRKSYKKALEWFAFTNPKDLKEEDRLEYFFKRGHAHFEREEFEEARQDLAEVKDIESEYRIPALYYYSHIVYTQGQYETALDGFKILNEDENFKPVAPYYITQILYNQERYDEVLDYAPSLVDSTNTSGIKRLPEIARLIGDSYYRESKYNQALPYLERYHEETPKKERSREDFFQLGYAYYQSGEFTLALDALNEASQEDDELAQSATYHMADCYLKLDKKEYARSAFKAASEMDHNIKLKEDALFNYAKLAFELSYNPFHEAITAFETYLQDYPDSERSDEAYEFLLSVYMKTKAYEKALESLDRIENKDTRTKEAYQVVAFNRGVELYKAGRYNEAELFFNKVNEYPVNASLVAEAMFWKAELAYASRDYTKAVGMYNQFLTEPGSYQSDFYNNGNYGLGYSLFNQKKYIGAASAFRKYIDQFKGDDVKRKNDALLRIGDCYYVNKDFDKAITYYNQGINLNQQNKDYAQFQKAVCYGLKGENTKKIEGLQTIIDTQINSPYVIDAKFQLAKTYLEQDNVADAKRWYQNILDEHETSPFVKHSLLDLCLINVKQGNNQKVIELWNQIKGSYPNDKVTVDAFYLVENVLLEEGMMDELPSNLNLTETDIEEKVYAAAVDYAITGDCTSAVPKLEEYLKKYQPGLFATAANYHLANCYFEDGRKSDALEAYNYVVAQPTSDYSEQALVAAATINYNNKNYSQALNHYIELENIAQLKNNVLEAQIGQMRCHYLLGQNGYALEYAEKVILNEGTPADILTSAYLWKGKIMKDDEKLDDAYYAFAEVVKSGGRKGAEAKFNMAEIGYLKGAYKNSEAEIFQLIESFAVYDEWKYKGFLLLADVYVGLEDYFQARTTLNAILDNVNEEWVRLEAQNKLAQLEVIENAEENEPDSGEIEIDMNNSNGDNQ
ncbi:MAG: tetratricopeptide repeat protein [Flavobacteriales bacterium]|nr:tetratricopeptide repeat protein [Flavobacteriales bacterium]